MTQKYIFIYLQPPSLKEPVGGPQPRAEQKQRTISGGSSQEPDAQADCWHSLSCIWKLPFKVDTSIAMENTPERKTCNEAKACNDTIYLFFEIYIYNVSFFPKSPSRFFVDSRVWYIVAIYTQIPSNYESCTKKLQHEPKCYYGMRSICKLFHSSKGSHEFSTRLAESPWAQRQATAGCLGHGVSRRQSPGPI